jgi:hypothetical protein
MEWVVPVLVAIIGGPLVVFVQSFRKESSDQHAVLAGKIDKLSDKLDGHIDWHLKKPKPKPNKEQ